MDDLEQTIKSKLLEGLIEHMQGKMGDDLGSKYPQKALEVSVAAPDKEHLAEGLAKAHEMTSDGKSLGEGDEDEGSDEDRLMALLGDDEDDEEKSRL